MKISDFDIYHLPPLMGMFVDYIENECEMKNQYIKRVDDFFEFSDKNNCKRVYEAIKKMDYE